MTNETLEERLRSMSNNELLMFFAEIYSRKDRMLRENETLKVKELMEEWEMSRYELLKRLNYR